LHKEKQHAWKEGRLEESIDTICVQIRQGLYFVMSFLEPVGSNLKKNKGYPPDPLGIEYQFEGNA
jgi:hypothetical protein